MNEQQKIQEEEDSLKWNAKKRKIKQEKENRKKLQQQQLLTPKIKNNLLRWVDKNKDGSVYEGVFGKEKCFEIRRGISIFSLKAIHEELKHCNSANCIDLYKLQKKANEMLWLNPQFLLKFKPVS